METKISRSAPELELQRAVHCLKYAETSTLQLKNVYSFVLKLNDGLKSAIMGLRATIRNLRKAEQERDYWKMRFEALQSREDNGGNWRFRYETLLERNVQLEEELRKVYSSEMAIEEFRSGRMGQSSPFHTSPGNGNTTSGNVNQAIINLRRVNAITSGPSEADGNNNNVDNADNDNLDSNDNDLDIEEENEEESDFEDDSEGAGVGGFLPMVDGPSANSLIEPMFNPTGILKIKCEADEEEEDEDEDPEEGDETKMSDLYETNSNPAENNNSTGSSSNSHNLLQSYISGGLNMIKTDEENDFPSRIDYEALRNCLAKDARQCPVCPRICSQRNSTVRHLIEVHHLDRSELMIRKFHKGYHFANFSK